jgi:membrane fusion protein, multidrug efflux system
MKVLMGVVALVGAMGCGSGPGGGRFQMPPTAVETVSVKPQQVADRFVSVGNIEAGEWVRVVSEIDGVVVQIPFLEGRAISRGDIVAKLDDAQLEAELQRAEAVRAQRKASYDRIKDVVAQGAGAPQDLDDAAAVLKVADADVALARVRIAKTSISAPFGGMVGARKVSVGSFVRAGEGIAELAQVNRLRVFFSVPERYLSKLNRGSEVRVSTTAYPGYELIGKIDVVEPVLDEKTRSARVMARLENPDGKFRPGMSADVSAVLSQRGEALTIPNEAVFVSGSDVFVFVVKADSAVTRRALTLGTRMADVVEVTAGLSPNEVVVRAGHQKLYEGAKVMPVQSREANTP